jgi:hypothetical protein
LSKLGICVVEVSHTPLIHSFLELLILAPVKVNLSFTRTERAEVEDMRRSRGVMSLVLDVLTTTVGNIHDALIELNVSGSPPLSRCQKLTGPCPFRCSS